MGIAAGTLERKLDDWSTGIGQNVDPATLLTGWLQLCVHTARADVAVVWLRSTDSLWSRVELSIDASGQPQQQTVKELPPAVAAALSVTDPEILRSRAAGGDRIPETDPTPFVSGLCGIRQGGEAVGVLEATWPADLFDASSRQLVPFLGASAELLGDCFVRYELLQLRQTQRQWQRYEQFLNSARQQPSLQALAQQIVHDGRALTGSERIGLLQHRGSGWKLLAVSGVDFIDPRSSTVQAMETLARALLARRSQVASRSEGSRAEASPVDRTAPETGAVDSDLASYREVTKAADVLPLLLESADQTPTGLLICERFTAVTAADARATNVRAAEVRGTEAWETECRRLQRVIEAPWEAAIERSRHWFSGSAQRSGYWSRSALFSGGAVLVIVLALALWLMPTTLEITAEGVLLPQRRQDVFARTSGVVTAVLVEHGDTVAAGQPLVEMRDADADLESTRLNGELATVESRLNVVQAARISLLSTSTDNAIQAQQLAGEEAELRQRLESLTAQLRLLELKRQDLTVTSPQAGEVLTWDPAGLLSGRPVERGQVLLSTGDTHGPWIVEARLRERDLGELPGGQTTDGAGLAVKFSPATGLNQVYTGRITDVARVTDLDERGDITTRIIITCDQPPEQGFRPGTSVIPKIDCGRRSLGYVWLREAWHAVQRQWWLHW